MDAVVKDSRLAVVRELRAMGATRVRVGSDVLDVDFEPIAVASSPLPDDPRETPEQRKARIDRVLFRSSGG